MALFIYNGVTISYCRTIHFEMIEERDPSGVDQVWTRYSIRVRGLLNFISEGTGMAAWTAPVPTGAALNSQIPPLGLAIKAALERPRMACHFEDNGQVIVDVPAGSIDARYGPDPQPVIITQVLNSGFYLVECGFDARVVDCPDNCAPSNPIVSLRWTQSEEFNKRGLSTLSTSGRLIVRSDMRLAADRYRKLCTPLPAIDYQRTRSKYTLSPAGDRVAVRFRGRRKRTIFRPPPYVSMPMVISKSMFQKADCASAKCIWS